jgi:hypothetical protein
MFDEGSEFGFPEGWKSLSFRKAGDNFAKGEQRFVDFD